MTDPAHTTTRQLADARAEIARLNEAMDTKNQWIARYSRWLDEARHSRSFWEGKFHTVARENNALRRQCHRLREQDAEIAALRMTLEYVRQYGSDTLSGRVDGRSDAEWYRHGVREMTRRARIGLEAIADLTPTQLAACLAASEES